MLDKIILKMSCILLIHIKSDKICKQNRDSPQEIH